MCELFGLSSHLPTRATFSLKTFAARGGLGGHSIDGWGLAAYDGHDVRLYKEPEPAGNSAWLEFIQSRRLPAHLLISHIRHATRGSLTLANTQPFVRELGGRTHVFAHNGRLDGIDEAFLNLTGRFSPLGDTDSEIAFCLLLEAMAVVWRDSNPPPPDARLAVVAEFAAKMRSLGPANFLYSDGELIFAHGDRRIQSSGLIAPPGLWCLRRDCSVDPEALMPAGVTIESSQAAQQLTLFASVPLSGEPWRPLAEGEIVVVADGHPVAIAAVRSPHNARAIGESTVEPELSD
jgi:predicted glutamine amidotransferase